MPVFVVKRDLPGITPEAVQGAGLRVKTCAADMQDEGRGITWVRSFFLPEKEQTHCYFDGPDLESVKELNERASIPYTEIVEVHEMTPEMV